MLPAILLGIVAYLVNKAGWKNKSAALFVFMLTAGIAALLIGYTSGFAENEFGQNVWAIFLVPAITVFAMGKIRFDDGPRLLVSYITTLLICLLALVFFASVPFRTATSYADQAWASCQTLEASKPKVIAITLITRSGDSVSGVLEHYILHEDAVDPALADHILGSSEREIKNLEKNRASQKGGALFGVVLVLIIIIVSVFLMRNKNDDLDEDFEEAEDELDFDPDPEPKSKRSWKIKKPSFSLKRKKGGDKQEDFDEDPDEDYDQEDGGPEEEIVE